MNPNMSALEAIGITATIAATICGMVAVIRWDYIKRGKKADFQIPRIIGGTIVGCIYFFGLLAAGLYLKDYWQHAPVATIVVAYVSILYAGGKIVKKTKKSNQ